MRKYIYIICLIVLSVPYRLVASEISAFGAGNLNSSSPYGLSNDEKVIYSNKIALKQIKNKVFILKSQIDSLQERIDGLQTVVEGIGQASHKNRVSISRLSKQVSIMIANQNKYQLNINNSLNQDQANIKDVNKTLSQVSLLLSDINSSFATKTEVNLLINKINNNYATKQQLRQLVKDVNSFKFLMLKMLKNQHKQKARSKLLGLRNNLVYKDAYSFYLKHQYRQASKYYRHLIKANYMPATSNYMLGEINYLTHNYASALAYYKASALLYNKSKFMPNLMLHTALSMSKTGDIAGAKKFLTALIAKYPSSKEASRAKSILKLLKP